MTGILERIGATSSGTQLLLILFLLSGQLLLLSVAIPEIGEALTATLLILTAVLFVGSGLIYLALLPFEEPSTTA